jgi:uncharacterized protein (DUF2141 family)
MLSGVIVLAQTNPIPFVNQPLVPTSSAPGGPGFVLTVNGTQFVSSSVVNWNGAPLTTTFVSNMQLTATVSALDIAKAGTASVTVVNPAPGGGTSGMVPFNVTSPATNLVLSNFSEELTVSPFSVVNPVVGDFNGDGKLDIAFVGLGTGSNPYFACIQLGNGDATFKAPSCTPTGDSQAPYWIVAGDFNHDGKLDLAMADGFYSADTLTIFLGNGDGTFQTPKIFQGLLPQRPYSLATADFNGDGKLDLAIDNTNYDNGYVSILLGDGDGTFQSPVQDVPVFWSPTSIIVGDFNSDGKLDLAISDTRGGSGIYLALGNGDGTFQTTQQVADSSGLTLATTADLNGDGKLDLIAMSTAGISILLGNGDGTFGSPVNYPTTYPPFTAYPPSGTAIAVDLNGDGKLDIVAIPWNGQSGSGDTFLVSALLGNGDGTFQTAENFQTPSGSGQPVWLTTGDFNGDGKPDLLIDYSNCVYTLQNCNALSASFLFFMQVSAPVGSPSPTSLTFGQQAVGTTSNPQYVTLTNTGNATLAISSISVQGQNASQFAETNNCGTTLPANANCQISVTFSPTVPGNPTAQLKIMDNSLGGPQTIALAGSTPPGPAVNLSPANINFPNQYVGTSGLPQTVVLTNIGNATLTITSVSAAPNDFGVLSACGSTLSANSSCNIGVFFDPTTTGARNGTLTVTDDAAGSPQTVPLAGVGQDFSVAPSSSSSATVTPGQRAQYTIAVAPLGGFNQMVTLSCTGAPTMSTCSVSPSEVKLSGSGSTPVTVSVATTGSSATLMYPGGLTPTRIKLALWLALSGLPGVVLLGSGRRKRRGRARFGLLLLCVLSVVLMWTACGGASGNGNGGSGGTPVGSYNLTVTGQFSSGSANLVHSTKLTLVVQ